MTTRALRTWLAVSVLFNVLFVAGALVVVHRKGGVRYLRNYSAILRGDAVTVDAMPAYYQQRYSAFWGEPPRPGAVIFAGDSLTEEHDWGGTCGAPVVLNRGISADTTVGLRLRVAELARHSPSTVFVMIGIADLRIGRGVPGIAETCEAIVRELRTRVPGARVVVEAVLPIDPARFGSEIAVRDIADLNGRLRALAQRNGASFLEVPPGLSRDGLLDPAYTTDGVHLNAAGYALWEKHLAREGCPPAR